MKNAFTVARYALIVATACAAIGARTAAAQQSPASSNEKAIADRDAIIDDLRKRVQALEERRPAAQPSGAQASERPRRAEAPIDEDLLDRALERSLVRSGGTLLKPGQKDFELGALYEYNERNGLAFGGNGVISRDFRQDTFIGTVALRAGLPWSSQVDITVPFGRQRFDTVSDGLTNRDSGGGLGDVQVGLSKQLYARNDGRLGLVGNVTYQRATGHDTLQSLVDPTIPGQPALGTGYDSWTVRLNGVARTDPLVFVTSLFHTFNRPTSVLGATVRASDSDGVSLKAILAASPDVSLRGGLSFARAGDIRIDDFAIRGTRTTVAQLELGTSVSVTRKTLVDVFVTFGMTSDAPRFQLGFSIPIRM